MFLKWFDTGLSWFDVCLAEASSAQDPEARCSKKALFCLSVDDYVSPLLLAILMVKDEAFVTWLALLGEAGASLNEFDCHLFEKMMEKSRFPEKIKEQRKLLQRMSLTAQYAELPARFASLEPRKYLPEVEVLHTTSSFFNL